MGRGLLTDMYRLALVLVPAASLAPAVDASAKENDWRAGWVEIGPGGDAVARVVTTTASCPVIRVDGKTQRMRLRAAAGVEALRPTRSSPSLSKPSVFPVLTCEFELPTEAATASVNGHRIPLPRRVVKRIVVLGDTGCRLKAADSAWQACNDPAEYPFARIAAMAAAWKPDLVIHVGDYLYRENPCPLGNGGCEGSPWGYGWDAWQADFFAPAKPLLAAAPWVMIRGNHENCNRGGQGWWRLLDPRRLEPSRDCNDPKNDALGDYQSAYTVPLGRDAQLVAMDIATSGEKALEPDDPRYTQLSAVWDALDKAAKGAKFTIVAGHYPILGLSAEGEGSEVPLEGVSAGVQSVFAAQAGPILQPGIDVVLSGHVHLWEQVSFAGDAPSQFITGFSGTQEDMPRILPGLSDATALVGGRSVSHFASWANGFGFMTMERRSASQWNVMVHSVTGETVNRCRIDGRRSVCEKP